MRRAGIFFALLFTACEQAPTDALGIRIIEPIPPGECTPTFEVAVVGHVDDGFRSSFAQSQLGPDGLYYVDERNSGGTLRLDASGAATYLTQHTGLQLLDAAGGSLLLKRPGNVKVAIELWRADEIRTVTEGTDSYMGNGPSPQPRLIDGDKVVWIREGAAVEVIDTSGTQTWSNLLPLHPQEAPYLRFPFLALMGQKDAVETSVVLYDLSQSWRTWESQPGEIHNVVITNHALVYLDGTRPTFEGLDAFARPFSGDDRPCSSLDTDGDRVVLACDPEGGPNWMGWLTRNHSLWVHDDTTGTREIDLQGRTATLPRVQGDTVAYLAYEPTDFCSGGPEGGVVVIHDLVSNRSVELAPITHGCFCCDAFWPNPMLELDGSLAAWNYDSSDPAMTQLALAQITRGCAD